MRVFGVGLIVVLAAGAVAAPGPSRGRGGYGGGGYGGGGGGGGNNCGYNGCATPTPTATVTAAPTATPTTPPPDKTAPAVNSRPKGGQTARSILKKGLILNVVCNENCKHVTKVYVPRKTARKLRIKRNAKRRVLVAKRTTLLKANVAQNIRVKLNKKAKRGVRRMKRAHVRKLKLTIATAATDAANNVKRSSTTQSFHR